MSCGVGVQGRVVGVKQGRWRVSTVWHLIEVEEGLDLDLDLNVPGWSVAT